MHSSNVYAMPMFTHIILLSIPIFLKSHTTAMLCIDEDRSSSMHCVLKYTSKNQWYSGHSTDCRQSFVQRVRATTTTVLLLQQEMQKPIHLFSVLEQIEASPSSALEQQRRKVGHVYQSYSSPLYIRVGSISKILRLENHRTKF